MPQEESTAVPSSNDWICTYYNHQNNSNQKTCGRRKLEDSIKFYCRQNPNKQGMRQRRRAEPNTLTTHTIHQSLIPESAIEQHQVQ